MYSHQVTLWWFICILPQESEKKRQEERMQQKRWQEMHRQQARIQEAAPHDADNALRRLMQTRDTGRTDWYTVEFETTHIWGHFVL